VFAPLLLKGCHPVLPLSIPVSSMKKASKQ